MSKELTLTESVQELVVTKRDQYLLRREGITRFVSRKANVIRTESNTEFASYVDQDGKASSNPAMYNTSINKKIAALFGASWVTKTMNAKRNY